MTEKHHTDMDATPAPEKAQRKAESSGGDVAQLRSMIAELLKVVEALHEEKKGTHALESRVSQLREANQNLVLATFGAQDMQATAEATNRRQTQFLSMLAHELRNPLAPIAMANELLGKITDAHPQLPKLHGIIDRQVNHMVRLVDDLLDASRVSSGKITLQQRPLLISEIIESAVETSQPFLDKRNQSLIIDLPADTVIYGDQIRLAQVFSNLLINATKFTAEYEQITISAQKLLNTVAVSVKDNGAGIAADIQPFIFDLFTQSFRSLDRSQGGLGIGLSLVRTIIEMHGGSVKVRSQGVGFGSEFIVTLPLSSAPLAQVHKAQPEAAAAHGCQILLIEDNADTNETLKLLLELAGNTITSIFEGSAGLAMAKKAAFDIIICDIGLPGIDGYEVIRQLRLHPITPRPYFIAISGYNQAQDRTHAIGAGFDHYLVKPIAVDALVALISSIAAR
jgi:two-component system CheB/CheR fusion protein